MASNGVNPSISKAISDILNGGGLKSLGRIEGYKPTFVGGTQNMSRESDLSSLIKASKTSRSKTPGKIKGSDVVSPKQAKENPALKALADKFAKEHNREATLKELIRLNLLQEPHKNAFQKAFGAVENAAQKGVRGLIGAGNVFGSQLANDIKHPVKNLTFGFRSKDAAKADFQRTKDAFNFAPNTVGGKGISELAYTRDASGDSHQRFPGASGIVSTAAAVLNPINRLSLGVRAPENALGAEIAKAAAAKSGAVTGKAIPTINRAVENYNNALQFPELDKLTAVLKNLPHSNMQGRYTSRLALPPEVTPATLPRIHLPGIEVPNPTRLELPNGIGAVRNPLVLPEGVPPVKILPKYRVPAELDPGHNPAFDVFKNQRSLGFLIKDRAKLPTMEKHLAKEGETIASYTPLTRLLDKMHATEPVDSRRMLTLNNQPTRLSVEPIAARLDKLKPKTFTTEASKLEREYQSVIRANTERVQAGSAALNEHLRKNDITGATTLIRDTILNNKIDIPTFWKYAGVREQPAGNNLFEQLRNYIGGEPRSAVSLNRAANHAVADTLSVERLNSMHVKPIEGGPNAPWNMESESLKRAAGYRELSGKMGHIPYKVSAPEQFHGSIKAVEQAISHPTLKTSNNKFLDGLDTVQHRLKTWQVTSPSSVVRQFIGRKESLLAEGALFHKTAAVASRDVAKLNKEDPLTAANGFKSTKPKSELASKVIAKINTKDGPVNFTVGMARDNLHEHGVMQSFALQGVYDSPRFIDKVGSKVLSGKGAYVRKATKVTSSSENANRAQLYLDYIIKNASSKKSLHDLTQEAEAKVTNVFMDYHDLTSVERQIFTRLARYYTYTRKSVPSFVRQVGRNPFRASLGPRAISAAYAQTPGKGDDSSAKAKASIASYYKDLLGGGKIVGSQNGDSLIGVQRSNLDDISGYLHGPIKQLTGSMEPLLPFMFELIAESKDSTPGYDFNKLFKVYGKTSNPYIGAVVNAFADEVAHTKGTHQGLVKNAKTLMKDKDFIQRLLLNPEIAGVLTGIQVKKMNPDELSKSVKNATDALTKKNNSLEGTKSSSKKKKPLTIRDVLP